MKYNLNLQNVFKQKLESINILETNQTFKEGREIQFKDKNYELPKTIYGKDTNQPGKCPTHQNGYWLDLPFIIAFEIKLDKKKKIPFKC